MKTHLRSILSCLALAMGVIACDGAGGDLSPQQAVAGHDVTVRDNSFEPPVLGIEAGDTVTWTWQGSAPHDVSGDGFQSDVQTTGTFEHVFDRAGEYGYVCTIHPAMTGLVVVAEP